MAGTSRSLPSTTASQRSIYSLMTPSVLQVRLYESAFDGYCGSAPTRRRTVSSLSNRLAISCAAMEMKPGRETALRDQRGRRALRQILDHAGGRHVFGQIEIIDALKPRGFRHMAGQVEGRGAQHRVMALQRRLQRDRVREVELDGLDAGRADRLQRRGGAVRHRDRVVAALMKHVGDGGTDLAGADNEDRMHKRPPE